MLHDSRTLYEGDPERQLTVQTRDRQVLLVQLDFRLGLNHLNRMIPIADGNSTLWMVTSDSGNDLLQMRSKRDVVASRQVLYMVPKNQWTQVWNSSLWGWRLWMLPSREHPQITKEQRNRFQKPNQGIAWKSMKAPRFTPPTASATLRSGLLDSGIWQNDEKVRCLTWELFVLVNVGKSQNIKKSQVCHHHDNFRVSCLWILEGREPGFYQTSKIVTQKVQGWGARTVRNLKVELTSTE